MFRTSRWKAAPRGSLSSFLTCILISIWTVGALAAPEKGKAGEPTQTDGLSRSQQNVPVSQNPVDAQIAARLRRILGVTGWYSGVHVSSREGVVTLRGEVDKAGHAEWAEQLAHDTDGVVAVMNEIAVKGARWFDLKPAREETEGLVKKTVAFLPYVVTSLVIILAFSVLAVLNARIGRRMARQRLRNPLMVEIVSKLFALPVILIGLYLVLRVCGLTGIAVTVLGGTGAIGLVAGLAMKGILENYFAGVILSIRNPYNVGDVVDVAGKLGVVQELTTRGTVLVDFDGNHIIIPNSTIYQNVITNKSANPTMRLRFTIGIGYQDPVGEARDIILEELRNTKGIIKDPEPLVLVEEFANSSVNFGVYYWIEPKQTNGGKLQSQVMENVKSRLDQRGFALYRDGRMALPPTNVKAPADRRSTQTENSSDTDKLLRQANRGRPMNHGESLL